MANKLDALINKSVKDKPSTVIIENSLADQLVKNADKALGIEEETVKKGSMVKNLTFTFGVDEVEDIDIQIERFLKQGKNVNKSELMRIGLQLIKSINDTKLPELITLISKHPRGRR